MIDKELVAIISIRYAVPPPSFPSLNQSDPLAGFLTAGFPTAHG